MSYITIHSYNPIMAALYGKKKSKTDRLINLRSELTHTEIQFSERYGGISFSATLKDGCKCARFKMIGYSHPERWCSVKLWVTVEQESNMFTKACKMADMMGMINWTYDDIFSSSLWKNDLQLSGFCYRGPNPFKYDTSRVVLSFISKRRIIPGRKNYVWCTEAVFIVLLVAFPEILTFSHTEYPDIHWNKLNPDDLHPSLGNMIVQNFTRVQKKLLHNESSSL